MILDRSLLAESEGQNRVGVDHDRNFLCEPSLCAVLGFDCHEQADHSVLNVAGAFRCQLGMLLTCRRLSRISARYRGNVFPIVNRQITLLRKPNRLRIHLFGYQRL